MAPLKTNRNWHRLGIVASHRRPPLNRLAAAAEAELVAADAKKADAADFAATDAGQRGHGKQNCGWQEHRDRVGHRSALPVRNNDLGIGQKLGFFVAQHAGRHGVAARVDENLSCHLNAGVVLEAKQKLCHLGNPSIWLGAFPRRDQSYAAKCGQWQQKICGGRKDFRARTKRPERTANNFENAPPRG